MLVAAGEYIAAGVAELAGAACAPAADGRAEPRPRQRERTPHVEEDRDPGFIIGSQSILSGYRNDSVENVRDRSDEDTPHIVQRAESTLVEALVAQPAVEALLHASFPLQFTRELQLQVVEISGGTSARELLISEVYYRQKIIYETRSSNAVA